MWRKASFFPHNLQFLSNLCCCLSKRVMSVLCFSCKNERDHHYVKADSRSVSRQRRTSRNQIFYLCSCLCSCLVPVRRPGSQQQQRCERSHQPTQDARVQLKQSPHLSFPPSTSPPSSHMRKKRWLSTAGSHSMSWQSSSSCYPLQVCKI